MQTLSNNTLSPGVVLIVDDVPDNLSMLHDALDAAGYTVLVATDGASALQRAVQADPDIVLLDAVMPGIDGFEVARRLKAGPDTAHIPIIFMTGLTDTEHVLAAFEAGGVDYVTKPIPRAGGAGPHGRAQRGRSAGTAGAQRARRLWPRDDRRAAADPRCRRPPGVADAAGAALAAGVLRQRTRRTAAGVAAVAERAADGADTRPLARVRGARQLVCTLQGRTVDDDWLVVLREVNDAQTVQATMLAFGLTLRESEVLYWVVKGKANRDIGDILGSSPATVKKHLERVYEKLGVETRTGRCCHGDAQGA
jgi:CheY-like chemotaxis protein/DNA-binding CsgD family transcriptional regulator